MLNKKQILIYLFFLIEFAFNQSIKDIKNIKEQLRLLELGNSVSNELDINDKDTDNTMPSNVLINRKEAIDYYNTELDQLSEIKRKIDVLSDSSIRLKYFGYDYFLKRDSIYFTNNEHVGSDYILGAGDEVLITMWGAAELNTKKMINKNGNIFIDNVGQIKLAGKKFQEAYSIIKNKFALKYSTIKSLRPTTFIDVNIGKLNPINLHLLGSVNIPGTHLVHPNSTIISSLIQTGGIDTTGSLRQIQLIRNSKIVTQLDLYNYLINGITGNNLKVRNGDIILVPNRKNVVSITGEIYREKHFEIKKGENLSDILRMAGGVKSNSSGKIFINRRESKYNKTAESNLMLDINDNLEFNILENDSIHFISRERYIPKFYIRGQVLKPGEYTLSNNISIIDALILAGGINDISFIKTMDLTRAEYVSRNIYSRLSDVRTINIANILDGDFTENYVLQPFDEITIYPNKNFLEIENIFINGEVIFPGNYSLKNEKTSLNNLIERAGGLSSRAFESGIKIFRDSSQVVWRNLKFNLFPGDSVFVPQKPGVVLLEGEVFNPGYIEYRKNNSLRSYIKFAGGFTNKADKSNIIVIYPNGNVKRKNFLISPNVPEGSTIVVSEIDRTEPLDWLSIAATTINLSTSIATILVLINQSQSGS